MVPNILFMSRAAALGMHAMALLADSSGALVPTHVLAERLAVSEAHLAKVLQRLSRHGLVIAVRARGGGVRLARPAREVTLLQILETIDGTVTTPACLLGQAGCLPGDCMLGNLTSRIGTQVRRYFDGTLLSDLGARPNVATGRQSLGPRPSSRPPRKRPKEKP
jgi:Rrf2 family protein